MSDRNLGKLERVNGINPNEKEQELNERERFFSKVADRLISRALNLIRDIAEGRFPVSESTKPIFRLHLLVFKHINKHSERFIFLQFKRYFQTVSHEIYLKIIDDDLDEKILSKLMNIEWNLRLITAIIPFKEKVIRTQIIPAWVILNGTLPKNLPKRETLQRIYSEYSSPGSRDLGNTSETKAFRHIIEHNGPILAMIKTLRLSKLDVEPNCIDGIAVQPLKEKTPDSITLLTIFFVIYCYIYKQSNMILNQNGRGSENCNTNLDIEDAYKLTIKHIKKVVKGLESCANSKDVHINQLCPPKTSSILFLNKELSTMVPIDSFTKYLDLDLSGFLTKLQDEWYFSGLQVKTGSRGKFSFNENHEYIRAVIPKDLELSNGQKTLQDLFRIF